MQTYRIILLLGVAVGYTRKGRSAIAYILEVEQFFINIIFPNHDRIDTWLCYGYDHNKNDSNLPGKYENMRKIF